MLQKKKKINDQKYNFAENYFSCLFLKRVPRW
jgi:hypothetical protein